jgi:hypothetical protein
MEQAAKYWVATVSAQHAVKGQELGIIQVNHGKEAPLRRMSPGDGLVIYSPRDSYPDGAALQAFTALGRVADGPVYQGEMGAHRAFRRDVHWQKGGRIAPIRPMLDELELTRGLPGWGMVFRFGLRPLSESDFDQIAWAMGLDA